MVLHCLQGRSKFRKSVSRMTFYTIIKLKLTCRAYIKSMIKWRKNCVAASCRPTPSLACCVDTLGKLGGARIEVLKIFECSPNFPSAFITRRSTSNHEQFLLWHRIRHNENNEKQTLFHWLKIRLWMVAWHCRVPSKNRVRQPIRSGVILNPCYKVHFQIAI